MSNNPSARDLPGMKAEFDNHHQYDYQNSIPNHYNNYGNIYKQMTPQIVPMVDPRASYINPTNLLSSLFSPPPVAQVYNGECDRTLLEGILIIYIELGIDFNDVYNMLKSVILFKKYHAIYVEWIAIH